MSRISENATPQKSPAKTDGSSIARTGSVSHPFESIMMAVTSAQFAYIEAMNQYALAWVNASLGPSTRSEPKPEPQDVSAPAKPATKTGAVQSSHHAFVRSVDWLSVPVITGIDETFNDHLTKPRSPAKPQETDVLTLWKRSNEFEASHLAARGQTPDAGHREVA
ncbi:MAG: hypothetical protein JXQ99_25015 [Hyphomicrobiaceae bacterium]